MRLVNKLERWVWYGGATLAMIAGIVNSVGFLSFDHHAITHLTGTTSELSMAVARGDSDSVLHIALVLLSFLFGCMVSGLIIQNKTLALGRRYGVALALEAVLLLVAAYLMRFHYAWYGIYVASMAMGLQNAMASTYSGTLLRTTHVTGMFTDIGVAAGHWLRGLPIDRPRVKLSLLIITSFFLGGVAGVWMFSYLSFNTLYIPAFLTGAVSIAYTTYSKWKKPKEQIEAGIKQTAQWVKKVVKK